MKKILLVLTLLLASSARAADTYNIDPDHSTVGFSIKHLGISTVHGRFAKFKGAITVSQSDPTTARAEATIEAASIDTGVEARDKHLRSPDFFDVEKYPSLKFVSTKISPMKDNKFTMTGDLTMHGVTKPVTLDVVFEGSAQDPWGNVRGAFSATGVLNRKDFGITWNKVLDNKGLLIGDDVGINLEIEGIQSVEKPAGEKQPAAKPAKGN